MGFSTKVSALSIAIWMLVYAGTAAVAYLLWRRKKLKLSSMHILPILAFYLTLVLTITVVERVPERKAKYILRLFWSYREIMSGNTMILGEVFWNVMLFVPIGLLASALLRRHPWVSVVIGFLFSACIEILQLVTRRGYFEWDDIIHNSLGALIGFCLYCLFRKRMVRKQV